jgi:glucose-6-phosphate 1-dehydrogenase
VDPSRDTETLAEVVLEVNGAGRGAVPVALGQVHRRCAEGGRADVQACAARADRAHGEVAPDRLRLVLNPDAMALEVNVNGEDNR